MIKAFEHYWQPYNYLFSGQSSAMITTLIYLKQNGKDFLSATGLISKNLTWNKNGCTRSVENHDRTGCDSGTALPMEAVGSRNHFGLTRAVACAWSGSSGQ
jgi:hypothetical protein